MAYFLGLLINVFDYNAKRCSSPFYGISLASRYSISAKLFSEFYVDLIKVHDYFLKKDHQLLKELRFLLLFITNVLLLL